jgi:hypothetical protein
MVLLADLLLKNRRAGYPTDYLLARLPRRRTLWRTSCPAGSGEDSQRELDRELDWLHRQLEPQLRRELAPALLFFELPRLLAALRFSEARDRPGVAASLRHSRLALPLRKILAREAPFPETVRELGAYLAGFDPGLAGLTQVWAEQGWASLEQALAGGLLAAARREHPAGPVRAFLDRLADRQELLRRVKAERWQREVPGRAQSRRISRLRRALADRHPETTNEPATLDRWLLSELAGEWRQRGRSGDRLERLLDYLWTCQLAARDCGVRHLEKLLGEERVKEETIL